MPALASTLLLLALGAAPASPAALARTAATLRKLAPVEFAAGDIPPSLRTPLQAFRTQLGALVREVAAEAPQGSDPASLEKVLLAALAGQGIKPAKKELWPGALLEVHVEAPAGHPALRSVSVRYSIPECGEDALLTLLRFEGGKWQPALEEQSGPLLKISDGFELLSLALSPADAEGEVLAITADHTPWCTSSWRRARYRIYRIPPAGKAALLKRAEEGSSSATLRSSSPRDLAGCSCRRSPRSSSTSRCTAAARSCASPSRATHCRGWRR